ncbi:MAG: hypothetical protein AAFR93_06885 [Pseudomonadota bacterium]
MKRRGWIAVSAFCALVSASVVLSAPQTTERVCVATPPDLARPGPGFELLDFAGRDAWATRDWDRPQFAAFQLPAHWLFWRKNGPRVMLADEARFEKSPGCGAGEFTYLTAFGRDLVRVAEFRSVQGSPLGAAPPRMVLEKHHVLTFAKDRVVWTLTDPDGTELIAVTKAMDSPKAPISTPEGWTLTKVQLDQDLHLPLVGQVQVIRLEDGYSYQGLVARP